MTFTWGFVAGWWTCSLVVCIAFVRWKLRRATPPTKHHRQARREAQPCIACYGGDLPCVCKYHKDAVQQEPHPPNYMYGIMGLGDEE